MPSIIDSAQKNAEMTLGVGSWMLCSVGMLVCNKLAIVAFPAECTLVALQMGFTVLCMLVFCRSSLHFGSAKDVMRWCMVVPFFSGMLLTSVLSLKNAPMSLVITFRVLSPLASLLVERLYPNPLKISRWMLLSIAVMFGGVYLYTWDMDKSEISGIYWVLLNSFFAVGDRLLQCYMLAADQNPVDISKTGVTLLNNLFGMLPMIPVVFLTGEVHEVAGAVTALTSSGIFWIFASCVVGVGISYCGIWAQSMIAATSFLVLVNVNKFAIIWLEVFVIKSKTLSNIQILGASIAILGGVLYGQARSMVDEETKEKEKSTLLPKP